MFKISGIADEAGKELDTQIRAHQELGWDYLELRDVKVDSASETSPALITDISDADFDLLVEKIGDSGLTISGFASGLGRGNQRVTEPFEPVLETLQRTIPRMNRLGVKYIRTMSFGAGGAEEPQWREECLRRYREMARIAEDAGIVLAVENCTGWASESPENYRTLMEEIDSPAVRALYDTGNPASHGHDNTWDWWLAAKPFYSYIHIKAHTIRTEEDKGHHTFPDAGTSCVRETLTDLLEAGYDGFVSIEPHVGNGAHLLENVSDDNSIAAYAAYVEYGRRLVQVCEDLYKSHSAAGSSIS